MSNNVIGIIAALAVLLILYIMAMSIRSRMQEVAAQQHKKARGLSGEIEDALQEAQRKRLEEAALEEFHAAQRLYWETKIRRLDRELKQGPDRGVDVKVATAPMPPGFDASNVGPKHNSDGTLYRPTP